ncbi:unnamed protein product [Orchesella dallaii]|uniref:Uncharacterized protein n=1 Tax=Orchesella dallaii TaxID=48710 RepID=A0ABP1S2I8_9HEXA
MVFGYYTSISLLYASALFTSIQAEWQISVTQSPHRENASPITQLTKTGNCIDVRYNYIETKIQLTEPSYNRDSFKIGLRSSSCNVHEANFIRNRTLPLSGAVFVNRRKPACSFSLETSESIQVGVSFLYGTNGVKTEHARSSRVCHTRCTPWESSLNYPHSVYFTRNGNRIQINNGIHLFSDRGCTNEINHVTVLDPQQPNNLVEITSETNVQVKSFVIWKENLYD